jgi:hypothetical protein
MYWYSDSSSVIDLHSKKFRLSARRFGRYGLGLTAKRITLGIYYGGIADFFGQAMLCAQAAPKIEHAHTTCGNNGSAPFHIIFLILNNPKPA